MSLPSSSLTSPKMTAPELPPSPTIPLPKSYTPSLLTAIPSLNHVHLIIGSNAIASARCTRSLEVGAVPKVISPSKQQDLHHGIVKRVEGGEVEFVNKEFDVDDLRTLGRREVEGVVDAVFVTLDPFSPEVKLISQHCARLRIPLNVADSTSLSTFTLLSTYSDGPLQIGITTSGMGCKLASRLRRTVAASFPPGIGLACERLGRLRRRVYEEDYNTLSRELVEEEDDMDQKASFNKLVLDSEEMEVRKGRRIRWLSQICEYWPLQRLCELSDEDVDSLFDEYTSQSSPLSSESTTKKGSIALVGSGPGDPDLLTKSSLDAILSADLVLADKLVPEPILALIPRRTETFIARKFPGNADLAQQELLSKGLSAVSAGKSVVRLKQGDPYIYGRGAEEYEFFQKEGVEVKVIPGITSALSGTLYAGIPATHRAVADQVLICTGTGRKGVAPEPPIYIKSQTTVFLMACHRLQGLVEGLVKKGWPVEVPCAVVERASCKDQRVVRSTLKDIVAAVEEVGSRPPGMFVVGWACEVLKKTEGAWSVEEGL